MNTLELDIEKLQGKILTVESNIPLLLHKSDNTTQIFRVVPSVESGRLFCGGRKRALVAFPTQRLLENLEECITANHNNDGVTTTHQLSPGMQVRVIHTSEKSIVIDHIERSET